MQFTREQWAAAMQVAADKIVASGMTKEEAAAYIAANTDKICAWCLRLMVEGGK
jgi:hypothetical protein